MNEESTLQLMMRTLEQVSNLSLVMTQETREVVHAFLDMAKGNASAREINQYLREDPAHKPAVYFAKKEYMLQLENSLKQAGIPFVSCRRTDMNQNAMFLLKEKDIAKADVVFNKFRAQQNRGGIVPKRILWDQADGQVEKFSNISLSEALLFDKKATEAGINISVQNDYDILFDKKDEKQMYQIAASVAYDHAGKAGQIIARQVSYEDENAVKIAKNAMWNTEGYIIDRKGVTAMVTPRSYEQLDGTTRTFLKKNNTENRMKINQMVLKMDRPVNLTKEEYKKYRSLPTQEKSRFLDQIDKKHGCPVITREEKNMLKIHENSRTVMEEKIYKQSSYYTPDVELRPGVFREELKEITPEAEIERTEPDLLENVKTYHIEEEHISPVLEEYFHEDEKRHSRSYYTEVHEMEVVRGNIEPMDYTKGQTLDHEKQTLDRDYEELEFGDVYDKDGNGILDSYQDENGNGILDEEERF